MSDWNTVRLGDCLSVQGGYAFSSESFQEEGVPLIRISNIVDQKIVDKAPIFLPEEFLNTHRDYAAREYDSLIAMSGATTGKAAIVSLTNLPFLINQRVGRFIINDNETIDKLFLFYLIGFEEVQTQVLIDAVGGAQPNISSNDIERIVLSLPPVGQQQQIAKILWTVDSLIQKTQSLIDKYTAIKQGMMTDLFTHGIDLSGTAETNKSYGQLRKNITEAPELYQDTELGWVPKDWEIVELSQVVDPMRPIVYGILMPGTGVDDGIPVIKVRDIKNGVVIEDGLLITSHEIDMQYRRSKVKPDDLLYTIRGTVGRLAKVTQTLDGANITQDTARIAIKMGDEDFYMAYLDSHSCRVFAEINTLGVAVQGINLGALRKMPVVSPPILEQQFIKEKSKGIERLIAKEKLYVKKLKEQKKGLMQDLLTGKVRVN